MTRILAIAASIHLLAAVPLAAQFDFFFGNGSAGANTTTSYPAPYGNFYWGSRHQFILTATELANAGIPGGVVIVAVAFNVTAVNASQPHHNFALGVGHTANPNATVWATAPVMGFGPQSVTPAVGWNNHPICPGFTWDGVSNLVIETCHQNSSYTYNDSTAWTDAGFVSSRWYRADTTGICGNGAQTGTGTLRPDIRITVDVVPTIVDYQVNQPPALSLLVNNVAGSVCFPTVLNQANPASGTVAISSNLIGSAWDLGVSGSALVSATAGALAASDGQLVNLDVNAPVVFMNGFLSGIPWPGAGFPGMMSSAIAIQYTGITTPQTISLQAIILNPASQSAVTLSQATQIVVL